MLTSASSQVQEYILLYNYIYQASVELYKFMQHVYKISWYSQRGAPYNVYMRQKTFDKQ